MRSRAVKAVLVKELKIALRSKVFLFWNIVFPIVLLTFMVLLFAPKPGAQRSYETINVAIVPEVRSDELLKHYEEYKKYMNNFTVDGGNLIKAVLFNGTVDEALLTLRNGSYNAVVVIPEDAPKAFEQNMTIKARIYVLTGTPDPTTEQLAKTLLTSFFREAGVYVSLGMFYATSEKILEKGEVLVAADPEMGEVLAMLTKLKESAWNNTDIEVLEVKPRMIEETAEIRPYVIGWMTISIIFIEYMWCGILGASRSIADEFEKKHVERILTTNASPWELYLGYMLANLISLTIPTAACLLWGDFTLGAKFTVGLFDVELLYVIILVAAGAILTLSIGVLVGLLVRSAETASIIANIIIWPTMMLGGFWIPKFMLPPYLRIFAELNPLSVLMYAVVNVISYGRGIGEYMTSIAASLAISIALLAASSLIYKKYITKLL